LWLSLHDVGRFGRALDFLLDFERVEVRFEFGLTADKGALHHLIGLIGEPVLALDFDFIDFVAKSRRLYTLRRTAFPGSVLNIQPFVFLGNPVQSLSSSLDKNMVVEEEM
jgi:hypothetical protein